MKFFKYKGSLVPDPRGMGVIPFGEDVTNCDDTIERCTGSAGDCRNCLFSEMYNPVPDKLASWLRGNSNTRQLYRKEGSDK